MSDYALTEIQLGPSDTDKIDTELLIYPVKVCRGYDKNF